MTCRLAATFGASPTPPRQLGSGLETAEHVACPTLLLYVGRVEFGR
jgi:hypothetical protein